MRSGLDRFGAQGAFDAKPMMTSAPMIAMLAPMRSVTVGRWRSTIHNHSSDAAI